MRVFFYYLVQNLNSRNMKKIIVLICLGAPFFGLAQKNSVKLTLSPSMVLTNNIGINYERKLSDSFSANLRFNFTSKKAVPFNGLATRLLGDVLDSAGVDSDILSQKVISYGLGLQFKYFPGKKALEGFYFAPYFGYQAGFMNPFKFDFPDSNDPNLKHGGEVNTSFAFLGAGLGIGNQWIMDNGLTLDILWLGVGGGVNKFKLVGKDNSGGQVDYAEIKADVDQFLIDNKESTDQFGAEFTTSNTSSQIEIVAKHAFPYMKVLNFSIGYSF